MPTAHENTPVSGIKPTYNYKKHSKRKGRHTSHSHKEQQTYTAISTFDTSKTNHGKQNQTNRHLTGRPQRDMAHTRRRTSRKHTYHSHILNRIPGLLDSHRHNRLPHQVPHIPSHRMGLRQRTNTMQNQKTNQNKNQTDKIRKQEAIKERSISHRA